MSTAAPYSINDNIISGARYHLVATYCVMNGFEFTGELENPRAIPVKICIKTCKIRPLFFGHCKEISIHNLQVEQNAFVRKVEKADL